jgi:glycosyltransferase involved in cell wall biosynthesis
MKRSPIKDAWYMCLSLLIGQPFMIMRDDRKAMRQLIDRLCTLQYFDLVHADQLNMAQYAKRITDAFKLLDEHNALWLLYKRLWKTMPMGPRKWLLGRDWRLLKRYESRICREFDAVLAVSEEDKGALEEAVGHQIDMTIIPIAIDTDEVTVIERKAGPYILHVGTMYWPPNIDAVKWFIKHVYPIVRKHRSDVQFDVVGAHPPTDLITLNNNGFGVNVTGYVADPRPYEQRAAVMVVPLLAGGGMRVKILNALAAGIPIVSTTLGYEGIDAKAGRDILVGDTPEEFAAQVLRVLNDRALGEKISSNGRKLVEKSYDYKAALRPLDEVYERAKLASRKAQSARRKAGPAAR